MNLLKCNQESISFQSLVQDWINILTLLYQEFVPITIQKRQNVKLAKLSDLRLPALMCLQVQIDISNQLSFYRLLILLKLLDLPERSRFNRLTQRCGILFQYIRTEIVNQKDKPQYTIIDSLPATSPHYYGFKSSVEIIGPGY